MPIFNVEVSFETTIVVVADDKNHAYTIAFDCAYDAIGSDNSRPDVDVRGEVTSEHHLCAGWDGECVPYGGDGNTRLKTLLEGGVK